MRCAACGRLPDEPCCEKCHRAAELSMATYPDALRANMYATHEKMRQKADLDDRTDIR